MRMPRTLFRRYTALLLLLLLTTPFCCQSLSQPVRRVAIIGAGIAGLATAHAMNDDEIDEIQVFDSRSFLDTTAGAGVQLNGGLAVLPPDLREAVFQAGLPQVRVQSRNKKSQKLLQLDIRDVIERNNVQELIKDDKVMWVTIMRGALQQVLLEKLTTTVPKKNLSFVERFFAKETDEKCSVLFNKELVNIRSSGSGAECIFADGSIAGPFDLIVGCDGIKSACKEFVDKGIITTSKKTSALYSGLRIKYAVQDSGDTVDSATLTQYFGDGAYALDGIYGKGANKASARSAFLIYMDKDYLGPIKIRDSSRKIGENADWSQDRRQALEETGAAMLKESQEYKLPQDVIGTTIQNADRFFELGVYFHNPFNLNGWSREIPGSDGATVVLCGDSAHALPPFLGQGSNQAIQDAYCLASKVRQYNNGQSSNLKMYLKDYEKTRWPVTFEIFLKSAFLGYLETGGPKGVYSGFRNAFFRTMGTIGVAEKVLLGAAKPKI